MTVKEMAERANATIFRETDLETIAEIASSTTKAKEFLKTISLQGFSVKKLQEYAQAALDMEEMMQNASQEESQPQQASEETPQEPAEHQAEPESIQAKEETTQPTNRAKIAEKRLNSLAQLIDLEHKSKFITAQKENVLNAIKEHSTGIESEINIQISGREFRTIRISKTESLSKILEFILEGITKHEQKIYEEIATIEL